MATVVWTSDALRHVRRIGANIGRAATAAKWTRKITAAPAILATVPRVGSVVEEFGLDHIRELLVGPYRVIYAIDGDVCSVVAVVHSKQDLANVFDPDDLGN
jgi:plasmid stabilization system protein ParE